MLKNCFVVLAVVGGWMAHGQVLIPSGATWKFLDNGSNQGTAWRTPSFNDSAWASGPAELGYGDGDEATVVSFGPDPNNRYITTYFRHTFNVADPSGFTGLVLDVLRDDGMVVYINGTEVARDNMPSGTISFNTLATTALGVPQEATFFRYNVPATSLIAGANVIAVEIHQANATSSDVSFNLQLAVSTGVNIVRGPYLQMGTPNSAIVRWRTDVATESRVRYGTSLGALNDLASDPVVTTEHIVQVAGLQPLTRYYYEVGTGTGWFLGDTNDFFETAPLEGTALPTRIWVLGDSGTANANAAAVRNAYINFAGARHTDVWLMLGDNAYNTGTDTEFQNAVFNMYWMFLQNTFLWSTRGNHESDAGGATYFNIFSFPNNAQAGGVASGTEAYYSFNHGNIHFICLDSFGSSRSATGAQATWLNNDLASVSSDWIIAFWHHPPYSKGSHNSDAEIELIEMRQNILPILEAGGVDLVLCGHSHSYERSFLLDGHYGNSGSLTSAMIKNGGSGREDATGAYSKPTPGIAPHEGTVYVVAGSSGQISGGTLNHPAMFISLNNLGSLVLDIHGNRLDAKFLRENETTPDYFTIIKGPTTVPAAPTGLAATPGNSQVALAWNASAGADTYNVKRATASGGPYDAVATVATTSHLDTGLQNGNTYYYVVSAVNLIGESPNSSEASGTPAAPPPPPAAPTALSATAISSTQINLTWTDNANNETGFKIERQTVPGGAYSQIALAAADAAGFADTTVSGNTTYSYRVRATNPGGDSDYSNEASATTPPQPITVTFTSVGSQDGYITESSENSNAGGSVSSTASNSSALRAGDNNQDRQIKTFVSFNTASIPDAATILSATLRLRRGTVSGTNPFTTHGTCFADIKGGTGFSGSTTLAAGDFQSLADANEVATLSNAASNGALSTGAINSTGLSFINKTGTTQFRVYFTTDDNDDSGNDYIGWYSGENGTAANRPVLEVTYQ